MRVRLSRNHIVLYRQNDNNIGGSCRSWKKITKFCMMEARAKRQSVVVSVVLVVKMVNCVSPVKGFVALGKNPFNGEMLAKMVK